MTHTEIAKEAKKKKYKSDTELVKLVLKESGWDIAELSEIPTKLEEVNIKFLKYKNPVAVAVLGDVYKIVFPGIKYCSEWGVIVPMVYSEGKLKSVASVFKSPPKYYRI